VNVCTAAVVEELCDNCKDNSYLVLVCVLNRRVYSRKDNADQNTANVTDGRTDGRKDGRLVKETADAKCQMYCSLEPPSAK
jgi:hypothetical protein